LILFTKFFYNCVSGALLSRLRQFLPQNNKNWLRKVEKSDVSAKIAKIAKSGKTPVLSMDFSKKEVNT